jgi:GTP-binding protein Era
MTPSSVPHCGTVVLAGKPNAGKSTLLNAVVGSPLAIVSRRPQSTRTSVVGIRTEGDRQLILVDPPGLLEPQYLLQEAMLTAAMEAVRTADAVLMLHRAATGPPPPIDTLLPASVLGGKPVLTVLTAVDEVGADARPGADGSAVRVSAVSGEGLDALIGWCFAQLPEGPHRYPPDDLSTQPLRFFVEEAVREAAFENLGDELPYALAAQVEEFREADRPVYIGVTLYVERESQKGMVIGKRGVAIRGIGARARRRIEALVGSQVYLDLWVKVLPRWRKSPTFLRQLGFRVPTVRRA